MPHVDSHTPGTIGWVDLVTTDGPFLETKEALGGYYLLEAGDLDEVLKLARESASGLHARRDAVHG